MATKTKLHSFKRLTPEETDRFPVASLEYYLLNVEVGLWTYHHRSLIRHGVPTEMFMITHKSKSGVTTKTIITNGSN